MFSRSHSSFFIFPSKCEDMKIILVIIVFLAITGLNQATQESQLEKHQLKSLQSLVSLVGQSLTLSGPKPKSMMMNKNSRLNLPRPQSFYPIRIRNPKVKEKSEWVGKLENFGKSRNCQSYTNRNSDWLSILTILCSNWQRYLKIDI